MVKLPRTIGDTIETAALSGSKNKGYLLCIDDIYNMSEPNNYNQNGRKPN